MTKIDPRDVRELVGCSVQYGRRQAVETTERPLTFVPRGLSRVEAARYVGVSPGTFDKLVEDGTMPKPLHIRARRVWDRSTIDAAFTAMGEGAEDEHPNDFDHVLR